MEKDKVKIETANVGTPQESSLDTFVRTIIGTLQQEKKRAAVHTYTCTLHSYVEFAHKQNLSLCMAQVFTPGRLKAYEEHLRRNKCSWNTISTYMRTLKAIYNRLVLPGQLGYLPFLFKDVYTKVVPLAKRSLTGEQINTVMNADYAALSPTQQRTLAYFSLLFLLRGMPFIDLAYMQKGDLKKDLRGNHYLVYHRHKTGKQMTVRVPPEAVALLQKFKCKNSRSIYLFPILDEAQKNDDGIYLSYLKALRLFNKTLTTLAALLLPAGVKLSSYTARHTWATLAYRQGTPVGAICKALGHSSIRVTENYLKPFDDEEVDKVNAEVITNVTRGWKTGFAFNGV